MIGFLRILYLLEAFITAYKMHATVSNECVKSSVKIHCSLKNVSMRRLELQGLLTTFLGPI